VKVADVDHGNAARTTSMAPLTLDLKEIQGDVLMGLQKNGENFIFFKIVDVTLFKGLLKGLVLPRIANSEPVKQREFVVQRHKNLGLRTGESLRGLNVGFTKDGLTQLIGSESQSSIQRSKRVPITRKRSRLCTILPKRIGYRNSPQAGLMASCWSLAPTHYQ
jgi:hypothetical protein